MLFPVLYYHYIRLSFSFFYTKVLIFCKKSIEMVFSNSALVMEFTMKSNSYDYEKIFIYQDTLLDFFWKKNEIMEKSLIQNISKSE